MFSGRSTTQRPTLPREVSSLMLLCRGLTSLLELSFIVIIGSPNHFLGGMHFSSPMEITSSQLSPTSWNTPAVVSSQCSSTTSSAGDLTIRLIIFQHWRSNHWNLSIIAGVQQGSEARRGCLWCRLSQDEIFQLEGAAEFKENVYSRVRNKESVSHNS